MSGKRRGLGRGIGALIPTSSTGSASNKGSSPTDVFFPQQPGVTSGADETDGRVTNSDASAVGAVEGSAPDLHDSAAGVTADASVGATAGETDGRPARSAVNPADTDSATTNGAPELVPVPGASFAELPVESIRPNSQQPRTVFDDEELDELAASIAEVGVLQPVVVRPDASAPGRYELIMGERRWRATQAAGLATIPAVIRATEESDLLRDALLENLHRSALNPLEEAAAYQQLLDDFGCTHDELSARIARSRPQISNTLRLLKLPPLVQRRVAAGVISAGHARALLRLEDPAAMERLAQRIVAEGLSVRATEEIAALGGVPEPTAKRAPRAGTRVEAIDDLASRLADRFDTRVKIALGKRKGRLTVEFASVDDLNRIVSVIAPGEDGLFPKK